MRGELVDISGVDFIPVAVSFGNRRWSCGVGYGGYGAVGCGTIDGDPTLMGYFLFFGGCCCFAIQSAEFAPFAVRLEACLA